MDKNFNQILKEALDSMEGGYSYNYRFDDIEIKDNTHPKSSVKDDTSDITIEDIYYLNPEDVTEIKRALKVMAELYKNKTDVFDMLSTLLSIVIPEDFIENYSLMTSLQVFAGYDIIATFLIENVDHWGRLTYETLLLTTKLEDLPSEFLRQHSKSPLFRNILYNKSYDSKSGTSKTVLRSKLDSMIL